MALDWADLPQTMTYQEADMTETADGNVLQAWHTVCILRGLIQPYSNRRKQADGPQEDEGLLQKKLYSLYCNFVISPAAGAAATRIQFAGRILDSAGREFRVEYADDEAGQGDHLKILLSAQSPTGD